MESNVILWPILGTAEKSLPTSESGAQEGRTP